MAATLTQKDLDSKRQRIGQISDRLNAILKNADGTPRTYTADEAGEFDRISAEGHALKAEVQNWNATASRTQLADDLKSYADSPQALRQSPVDPEEKIKLARKDFRRNRYSLRFFDDSEKNGHENAYHAGLLFLATCGTGSVRDWAVRKCKDRSLDVNALSPFQGEDGNTMGGYLVFPEFERTLIILRELYGVAQREFYKLPMGSDTLQVPRRSGGTTVYYPGENTQLQESAMAFSQLTLTAKKYAQLTRWSSELNEDSVIAMSDLLAGEAAYQFTKSEDLNGFIGDGTSTYAGVTGILFKLANAVGGVSCAASLETAAGTHTTVGATTLADWNKVAAYLPLYAEGRAKWFMHRSIFYLGILPLLEAAGGNIAMYLSDGAPLRFLGYPVVVTQAMPTASAAVGTNGGVLSVPAILGDMNVTGYMGNRRGVTTKMSDQRYLEFDQIALQITERVAINCAVGDSVAPATVPGPMVGLQLASS
jgi:HK97 family phage major capsid protein